MDHQLNVRQQYLYGERAPHTNDWVDIMFAVIYWLLTITASVIFIEVLRGMSVREKVLRKRRISKALKIGYILIKRDRCFLCHRKAFRLLSFYLFALLTLLSKFNASQIL
jgi:hypothetical protein